jgi:hypothetical protein
VRWANAASRIRSDITGRLLDPRWRLDSAFLSRFDQDPARDQPLQKLRIARLGYSSSETQECLIGRLGQAEIAVCCDVEKDDTTARIAPMKIIA